ncbi:UEV domain-containing protein [Dendryphion nanum]|uniref:UEV domain-containing protein n=1 Tax=Dendryphion nanum TaxID=256645 RepID=A0A9P9IV66_9PLEO|nr:UEV domain-containing protein [Dendryphion nanum]
MSGVPEKVLNWLYSVLPSEYADVNRTYQDVAETLSNYPSLSPRTEVYTYENGASALLLLLDGTVPVAFRGTKYGFPVAIWVPHAYPREPPIVYVVPSPDMIVRPGQHVSGDGRIYHPYLAQWGQYWDKSTIFDFLAVLRGVFAKEPPVRSKQPQAQQAPPPPPPPPPPADWRRSTEGRMVAPNSPGASSQGPAPPPKPPKPLEQDRGTPRAQVESRYSKPPPLPSHPQQQPPQNYQHTQRGSYDGNNNNNNNWQHSGPPPHNVSQRQASWDANPATPVSKPTRPYVQAPGIHNYQSDSYQIGSPVSPMTPDDQRGTSRYQKPPPPPPIQAQDQPNFSRPHQYQLPQQTQQQYPPGPPAPPGPSSQHPFQQQQQPYHRNYPPQQPAHSQYQAQPQAQPLPPQPAPAPINLLDDTLEVTLPSQTNSHAPIPAPPIPPNPEKDALLRALSQTLTSHIRQTVSSNTAALAPLRAQQFALQTAYSQLQSELDQLQQLDAVLASNEKILRDAMVEADRVMEEGRRRKAPDVDDVLVAPTVVGGQLYTLAAEEKGIADALFVLGRALDKGRIGADVFVKQTRSLAREQFLKKALIKKIAKGMALDDYQMR